MVVGSGSSVGSGVVGSVVGSGVVGVGVSVVLTRVGGDGRSLVVSGAADLVVVVVRSTGAVGCTTGEAGSSPSSETSASSSSSVSTSGSSTSKISAFALAFNETTAKGTATRSAATEESEAATRTREDPVLRSKYFSNIDMFPSSAVAI